MRRRVSNPKVSVIIPTFNRARDLPRCLASLIAQDLNEFEVLICDDGSTDNTSSVVETYTPFLDITYSYGDHFGGPGPPRNRAIKLVRAPYVAFLDSDDWWAPEKLRCSVEALDAGVDVVYHDLFVATKATQRFFWKKSRTRDLRSPVYNDLLIYGNALTCSSVVVKTELLTRINGFSEDPDFISFEDYEAWLRIARITEKFKRIPQTLGYYWLGGGNMSNTNQLLKNISVIQERFGDELSALAKYHSIYWINYISGRSYFRLGSYAMAKKSLELIGLCRVPLSIYMKSQWMLMFIRLSRARKKNNC